MMTTAHSFPQAEEFQTERNNLSFAVEFTRFCKTLWNLINAQ